MSRTSTPHSAKTVSRVSSCHVPAAQYNNALRQCRYHISFSCPRRTSTLPFHNTQPPAVVTQGPGNPLVGGVDRDRGAYSAPAPARIHPGPCSVRRGRWLYASSARVLRRACVRRGPLSGAWLNRCTALRWRHAAAWGDRVRRGRGVVGRRE